MVDPLRLAVGEAYDSGGSEVAGRKSKPNHRHP